MEILDFSDKAKVSRTFQDKFIQGMKKTIVFGFNVF